MLGDIKEVVETLLSHGEWKSAAAFSFAHRECQHEDVQSIHDIISSVVRPNNLIECARYARAYGDDGLILQLTEVCDYHNLLQSFHKLSDRC